MADHPALATPWPALRPGGITAGGISPGTGLGPLLSDQFVEFSILEKLGHRANGEAQGSHRGAQREALLNCSGGAHLVVAEPDAESAGFAVAWRAAATGTPPLVIARLRGGGFVGHRLSLCGQGQVCRIGWPRGG